MSKGSPLIVHVALNGEITREQNPHVPFTPEEMSASVDACIAAGASMFHAHTEEPVRGPRVKRYSSAPHISTILKIREKHPSTILYPTMPFGPGLTMADRLAHMHEIIEAGLLNIVPMDPGAFNFGRVGADGVPRESLLFNTSFADVCYAFDFCRDRNVGCSMSIFEPGFLQVVLAHQRAGTLPTGSMVKLEFSGGKGPVGWLFGLPPNEAGLGAYLNMLEGSNIPWFVTLRGGDVVEEGLARMAIANGGHVRIGIHDYAGSRTPRNEELVAELVALGRSLSPMVDSPTEFNQRLRDLLRLDGERES